MINEHQNEQTVIKRILKGENILGRNQLELQASGPLS